MVVVPRVSRGIALLIAAIGALSACDNNVTDSGGNKPPDPGPPPALHVDGRGAVSDRFTAELWILGSVAYTTTWGTRTLNSVDATGNAIKIWDVSASQPQLIDSVIVPSAGTLGDIQASDDGKLLVVATEFSPGSIVIYDLTDPRKPQLVSRFSDSDTDPGVHTAHIARVNGTLYAFLCVDPSGPARARLVIVDLSDPANPAKVFAGSMGNPFVHDVDVRDGILMTALWNDGISIFDIGGGAKGGTPANPVLLGSVRTMSGKSHNIWWFHDAANGTKRYAFVGEEGPASIGSFSSGDVHIVDVSDLASPREVGFFNVPGAGTHNFSVDESGGILYAAYYNGGVRALNVRGNLGLCDATMKSADGRCDLGKMGREVGRGLLDVGMPVFVWGVQSAGGRIYASDMLNGLWKLEPAP